MKGVLSGNLGESMRLKSSVASLVAEKLPVTLQLASMAIVIALGIGIPAGIVSAVKKDTAWDYGANLFALWGLSTPNFWLGILMIFLFSVTLGWLPASGYVRLGENWRASLATTIMPAFVLGNAFAAVLMRHTRSAMLQAMGADYVRTARAKGLHEARVVLKHALRNAMTPVITLGALEFGTLLSGAVLTEQIFTIPGFGKLIVDSGVQPRLCRGAGRRAGDRHDLHPAQPAGRHGLRAGQPRGCADEHDVAASLPARAAAVAHARRTRGRARLAAAEAPQGRDGRPFVVVVLFIAARGLRAADRALRSHRHQLHPGAQAAVLGALARHRRGRPRRSRRIIFGARASLSAGLVSVGIALGAGVPLGLLAGYAGGWIDAVLSRIVDAMLAIPFLILAIALAAFLGPSLGNAMIAIGVTATPIFVRLTRGQVMAVKVEDYVEAARAVGNPHWRIALRHILPNIVPPLLVQATLAIAGAIIAEAACPSWASASSRRRRRGAAC